MSDIKCPICNKPMKEQIDGTCISYQETNCICNIAAPKLIWKEMAVLRDKKNIFTKSILMEKEFAEEECKRLQTELDRTRKALDVALCSLQDIAESDGDFITGASTPLDEHEYADMMLKEIKRQMKIETVLEQKD